MKELRIKIHGTDTPAGEGVTLYRGGEQPLVLGTKEYNFVKCKVMIFGADGILREAGGELWGNVDGTLGSPQVAITIPAGGFAIAFGHVGNEDIRACFDFAMEGAMLYNATMVMHRRVEGRVEGEELILTYEETVPTPTGLKFLFIGNSCTYFHGVPLKFRALCKEMGIDVDVTYCTRGAAYLHQFADTEHEYHTMLLRRLEEKRYDFAVLQDAGSATAEDMEESITRLLPLIEKNGARPYLYMRCAPSAGEGVMQEESAALSANYRRAGETFGITVTPAAEAFVLCRERHPEIELYADDRSHHSGEGSYLAACCMTETFLGLDVRGNAYDAYFGTEVAKKLQAIAHEVCGNGVR